jgi:hypothetical protein
MRCTLDSEFPNYPEWQGLSGIEKKRDSGKAFIS